MTLHQYFRTCAKRKGGSVGKLSFREMACIVFVFCAATAIALSAQTTFKTLVNFDGTNGLGPQAPLIQGTDGNLYSTTVYGGSSTNCSGGCGTVFKIGTEGKLTTLHSFNGTDGAELYGGLVQATDGNFYGTTRYGGTSTNCEGVGCGSVFKITPAGKLTTIFNFHGVSDGFWPVAGLVQGTDGNLYGTTSFGGTSGYCGTGCGTVFKISTAGKLSTLHSFGGTDGYSPEATLVQGTNGSFYGTTEEYGANGYGTIFEITPAGKLTTLYNFPDGYPFGALVQAVDGNFYGVTGYPANGTIFKISPTGELTTIYSFCSQTNCPDGLYPYAGLVQGTDGKLYGTTAEGGKNVCVEPPPLFIGCGTIFKITTEGKLTTLYNFCSQAGCADGNGPEAGLVQATDGRYYGSTAAFALGSSPQTIFSLSVGLRAFVKTNPTSGKVGEKVIILGNNLNGTSSVTFNGTTASLLKVTPSAIETSVPTGATTGTVIVTTPSGALNSNMPFRVLP